MPREPTTKIVAIHQPNFFPWLGYFDKIRRADVFVFLDDVQYTKQSWINRVRLNIQGEARWVTCPVQRRSIGLPIADAEIDDDRNWRERLLKTLESNYRRAARYDEAMGILVPLITADCTNLCDFNIATVTRIAEKLDLQTEIKRQSQLPTKGSANELLASIVRECNGDRYLKGGGADGYHDPEAFAVAGVAVVEQNFVPTPYGPTKWFIPGLSVIDYLMHDGGPLVA